MRLPRGSNLVWLLAIVAGAAALRVVALGRADLWTDEIQTLHAVQLGWGDLIRERLAAGHVPLYFLVEKAWCAVAGTSQFALRFPAAVFGVAMLAPAWSLFRRLGDEKTAWAGATLVAVHPLLVELSREARMYSLLGFLALVVADGVVATLDGERAGWTFWLAAALGPLVHPTWGVAMLPLAAWFALERRRASDETKRTSRAALVGLAATLAVLGALLLFAKPQHQELTRRPWPREIGVFVLRLFTGSDLRLAWLGGVFAWLVLAAAWLPALAGGIRRAAPRARRLGLVWAVGVPILSVTVGVVGGLPWGPARYLQCATLGICALVALGVSAAPSRGRLWAPLAVSLLLSGAPVLSPPTAWSDVADRLRSDPSPVVVPDESSRIVLSHYLGRDVFVGTPPVGAATWRRASLETTPRGRRVRIEVEPGPR